MRELLATTIGLLVASAVPILALTVENWVLEGGTSWVYIGTLFPIGYVFSLVASVVFGLPMILAGNHLGLLRWWSVIVVGFLIGVLMVFIVRFPNFDYFSDKPPSGIAKTFLSFGAIGALTAFAFWSIWRLGVLRSSNDFADHVE